MDLNKHDSLSYYSFINCASEESEDALILNRLLNVKMKYEFLKDVSVKEKVTINGHDMTLRNAFFKASIRGVKIFEAV